MSPCKILIIDDDETIKFSFKTFLSNDVFDVFFSKNGKEGLEMLTQSNPAVVIADYKMPEMSGLEFLKAAKIIAPNIPIIIMSAYGDDATRSTFLNEGAHHYLEKPFSLDDVLTVIDRAKLSNQSRGKESTTYSIGTQPFVGRSKQIRTIFNQIEKVAATSVNILIQGESGTGKDLIAQGIHKSSHVSNGPFVSLNCSAIPENLIESELFGYEKGAFTGADQQKIGKFDLANNGTLFLDEIGELSLHMQSKLLRVLQNKTFERVGGTNLVSSNARIIAATNKNLFQLAKKGEFRDDLYYRLSAFPIHVPALRERADDIPLIAMYLLEALCREFNKPQKSFSPSGISCLKEYDWPGNVREMQNIISRIVLLELSNTLDDTHLCDYFPLKTPENFDIQTHATSDGLQAEISPIIDNIVQYNEQELLHLHAKAMYKKHNYNKSDTADAMGINYRTLMKRLDYSKSVDNS